MRDLIEHDLRYYLRFEKRKWRTDLLLIAAAMFAALSFAVHVGGILSWIIFAVPAAGFLAGALVHWYRTDPSQELKRINDTKLFYTEGEAGVHKFGGAAPSRIGLATAQLVDTIRQRGARKNAFTILVVTIVCLLALAIITSGPDSGSNPVPAPAYGYPTDYPGTHP